MSKRKAKQPTPRQIACRKNASKGGKARARNLSAEEKKRIASMGGKAIHHKLGDSYYGFLSRRRKRVGRHSIPVELTRVRKRVEA